MIYSEDMEEIKKFDNKKAACPAPDTTQRITGYLLVQVCGKALNAPDWLLTGGLLLAGCRRKRGCVGAVEKGLRSTGGIFIAAAEGMGVDLEGDGSVAVAKAGGHGYRVDVISQKDGSVGVAEVVKADALKAVGIGKTAEPF